MIVLILSGCGFVCIYLELLYPRSALIGSSLANKSGCFLYTVPKLKGSTSKPAAEPYPRKGTKQTEQPPEEPPTVDIHPTADVPDGSEGQIRPSTCTSNDDDSMIDYTCVSCNVDVGEGGIECQWRYGWEHRSCAGITQSEYSILTTSSSKIMFFCSLCYTKVPFALKLKQESTYHYQTIDNNLKATDSKLVGMLNEINTAG